MRGGRRLSWAVAFNTTVRLDIRGGISHVTYGLRRRNLSLVVGGRRAVRCLAAGSVLQENGALWPGGPV